MLMKINKRNKCYRAYPEKQEEINRRLNRELQQRLKQISECINQSPNCFTNNFTSPPQNTKCIFNACNCNPCFLLLNHFNAPLSLHQQNDSGFLRNHSSYLSNHWPLSTNSIFIIKLPSQLCIIRNKSMAIEKALFSLHGGRNWFC